MFPIIKYWVRREKIKFLYKSETTAYWKKFHVKLDKKEKIFFCTPKPSKFQEILTLNISDGAKQRNKKKILPRDTLQISVVVIGMCNVKKVSFIFKIAPSVSLHIN